MKIIHVLALLAACCATACGGGDEACTPLKDHLVSIGIAPYAEPLPADALAIGWWHPPYLLVPVDPQCRLCGLPVVTGPYYDPAALPANVCRSST